MYSVSLTHLLSSLFRRASAPILYMSDHSIKRPKPTYTKPGEEATLIRLAAWGRFQDCVFRYLAVVAG